MTQEEKLRSLFSENDGFLRAGDIRQMGLHSVYLTRLNKAGKIARIRRGIYEWVADGNRPDVEIISRALPEAIICLNSALDYYGYIDRTPDVWHIAMDRNHSRWRAKLNYPPLKVHYVLSHLYNLGRTQAIIDGVSIRIYDRERTLCDTLRYANKLDPEIVHQAIRGYIKDMSRNISHLKEYSKLLRVERMVRNMVEVWL